MPDIKLKFKKNYPLAPLTTFKIGGKAKFFIEVKNKSDITEACGWAEKKHEPVFIIGGGSNILVNDKGASGLVMRLANDTAAINREEITAGAGLGLAKLINLTAKKGLSGLEWASGIPRATLGGALRGNAGAFGASAGDLVRSVEVYNLKKNRFERLKKSGCGFGYRESIFKKRPEYIIWQAELKFKKSTPKIVEDKIKAITAARNRIPYKPSAGSVFKNLTASDIEKAKPELMLRLKNLGVSSKNNIGAGLIIDKILDLRGKAIGGAEISPEHGNVIINKGGATADNVAALICYIKTQARNRLGLKLQEEIQYLGF